MCNNLLQTLSDTSVLKDAVKTQAILTSQGFKKVYFQTSDNYNICGLFLDQSKKYKVPIKGTLVFAAGFYPGTKEGMATFYAMFADQPYNFLFFDARCHNESSGKLTSYNYIKQYGQHEYQDIIAATEFVNQHNQANNLCKNIVVYGTCSGAFHCAKAVCEMKAKHHPLAQNIKGIIFDSGWTNLPDIVEPVIESEVSRTLKNSYFSKLNKPLNSSIKKLYQWSLKKKYNKIPNINKPLSELKIPILFIHSKHDTYAPIKPVQELVGTIQQPTIWWDDVPAHATSHLKKQQEYTKKMNDFLQQLR